MDRFKLAASALAHAVEIITDGSVEHFTFELHGPADDPNKSFATLRYRKPNTPPVELPLFIKKCVWQNRSEAIDYRYLSAAGIPTPHLYAAILNPDGDEILFLEHLTAIGFNDQSETEWRQMLTLLARFNACPVTPAYAEHLYPYEQGAQLDAHTWYTGLDPDFDRARTETDLLAAGADFACLPSLLETVADLFAQIDAQPRGLLHQDFHRENIGWHGDRAELVVFDLHKNALGPRFADVASYLGTPDWTKRAPFLDTPINGGTTRRDLLIQHFLHEYALFGGDSITPETFRAETSVLLWAHKIKSLSLLHERQQYPQIHTVLEYCQHPNLWAGAP